MNAAGAAQLLERETRISRVEEESVHLRRQCPRLRDHFAVGDVQHLHDPDLRQGVADDLVGAVRDPIDQLHRVGAAASEMIDDRAAFGFARQQKRRDRRRNAGRDLRDQPVFDDAGTAWHPGDEPQRRRASGHGEPSFFDRHDAADLDPRRFVAAPVCAVLHRGTLSQEARIRHISIPAMLLRGS